jgi:hypothetical protein
MPGFKARKLVRNSVSMTARNKASSDGVENISAKLRVPSVVGQCSKCRWLDLLPQLWRSCTYTCWVKEAIRGLEKTWHSFVYERAMASFSHFRLRYLDDGFGHVHPCRVPPDRLGCVCVNRHRCPVASIRGVAQGTSSNHNLRMARHTTEIREGCRFDRIGSRF